MTEIPSGKVSKPDSACFSVTAGAPQDAGGEGQTTTTTTSHSAVAASTSPPPLIISISWGQIHVEGLGHLKDAKLWPGGGRAWNWNETGTRHTPGIQVADVQEILEHGAQVVVLSRGMEERLGVADDVVEEIRNSRGVTVRVAETKAAVEIYNDELRKGAMVGGLFHSTC